MSANLGVGAGTWDDGSLDGQGCPVAASITSDNRDLAMGSNERRNGESQEDNLREHLEW